MRRRGWWTCALVVVALMVAGCQESTDAPPRSTEIEGSYGVGEHRLHLQCRGSGEPTIVYLHGLGGDANNAGTIPAGLGSTRFCVYDRANMGRSEPAEGRQTGADSVRDLHTLLDAAKVSGPYVLLGASHGGLLATMDASTYPDQVVGLVLLDPSLPNDDDVDQLIPAKEREQVVEEQQANPENVDFYKTLEQARELMPDVPDIPVRMLAAKEIDLPSSWPVAKMTALIRSNQRDFIDAFPQGDLTLVDSPHFMEEAVPDVVVEETKKLLAAVA